MVWDKVISSLFLVNPYLSSSTRTRRTAETIIVKAESVRVERNLVAYKPEPLHTIVGAVHLNRFAPLSRV